jgi:hypothetical protein
MSGALGVVVLDPVQWGTKTFVSREKGKISSGHPIQYMNRKHADINAS